MIDLKKILKGERETIKVPLNKMGHEIGKKFVYFYASFLRDYLHAGQLDATDDMFIKSYDIICPYCKSVIKLVSIKPDYSGGMGRVPLTLRHTGNNYDYECKCGATFHGHYQWMWID
jgi:hypothetical protein